MIPIDAENLRDFVIAFVIVASFWGLFHLLQSNSTQCIALDEARYAGISLRRRTRMRCFPKKSWRTNSEGGSVGK
jgi:hypothetical protein